MLSIWEDISEEELQWKYIIRQASFGQVQIWEDGDIEFFIGFGSEDYALANFKDLQRVCDLSLEFCMKKGNDLV